MAVVLKDLISLIEEAAPPELKEEWDNPGLAVGDSGRHITRALVGLDLTEGLIAEALCEDAQLILTHHPMLFNRPDSITPLNPLGRKILKLAENGLCAYSAHTNLDKAQGGMNDRLMERLGFTDWSVLSGLGGTGIGRIAETQPTELAEMVRRTKEALGVSFIRYCGDGNSTISKVAVINGAGADLIAAAQQAGADCVITGDTKHHEVLDALEEGVAVIDPGHFFSEWPVFCDIMRQIQTKASEELGEVEFLFSQSARDPYSVL